MKRKGQITRIKNGKWQIRVQRERNGVRKSISQTIEGTRDDARDALKDLLEQIAEAEKQPKRPTKTFDELFDAYLEIIRPNIEEQTYYLYERLIRTYLRDEFGAMRVADLEPLQIEKYFNKLQKKYAGETISKIYSQFNASLKKAKIWKWRADNPMDDIQRPNRNKTPHGARKAKETLTVEELNSFFEACPNFASRTMWTFFALTGARPSEVLAARWQDVDFELKAFSVRQKLVQIKQVKKLSEKLKTDTSRRVIPLSDDLIQMLKKLKTEQNIIRLKSEIWKDNDLIFCTRYGKALRLSNLGEKCSAIAKDAGITKNITPNGFRHTWATLADENDLQGKAASDILGHATRKITDAVYVHPSLDKKRSVAETMSSLILNCAKNVRKVGSESA